MPENLLTPPARRMAGGTVNTLTRQEELEIENQRLADEVARLTRILTKVYQMVSVGVVHTHRGPGKGRPIGTTKRNEAVFLKDLFDTYERLPEDGRTREEVARELNISRRTLHRYLDRWSIAWPPQVETLEDVL